MKRKRFAAEVLDALMRYDWSRNNVRELRNIVERMVIASDGDAIGIDSVPAEIRGTEPVPPPAQTFKGKKSEAERQIIVAALERNDWNITRTAEELGLADHASLLKIMRRLAIKHR